MTKARIGALDGLKGIAIIAVVFTHLPLSIWYQSVPSPFHPLLDMLLGSGGIAVTLFFIITGYLMGLLYPSPNLPLVFWSRRYARLFPPFLVMVAGFTLFRLFPTLGPFLQIAVLTGCAITMKLLLVGYGKLKRIIPSVGTAAIVCMLLLQLATGTWYVFYLLHVPSAIYYQIWSPLSQTIVTALVNATLTLPLGQYIPQLDGIYWALAAEVLFYLLYPIVFAPLAAARWTRTSSILLILSLFPFSFGLYLIGQRLLGLETLKLHLIIYFAAGVLLSRHQTWSQSLIRRVPLLKTAGGTLLLLAITFSSPFFNAPLPKMLQPWVGIVAVIPVSMLLMTLVHETSWGHKALTLPALTFLGTYSYALFLTHSFVIHQAEYWIHPDTGVSGILLTLVTFAGSILFSWILYQLTEKQYFHATKKKVSERPKSLRLPAWSPALAVSVSVFILLYSSYKPPLALFTWSTSHGSKPPFAAWREQATPIEEQPLRQSFTAARDGLGMTLAHIRNQAVPGVSGGFVPSKLIMRLRNNQQQLLAESTYNAYEIIDSRYHPFGFPLQSATPGQRYTVEYQLSSVSPSTTVELVTSEQDIISVYFLDKHALFRQPKVLIDWAIQKLAEPLANPMFWITLFHIAPFLVLLILGTLPRHSARSSLS